MYAVTSLNDATYQPLADQTWHKNKEEYCKLHGYAGINKTSGFRGGNTSVGFEKIFFIKDLMDQHPEYEWIWWTGCDSLITNFTTKIEDKIDPAYDMVIATDCNGINSDSFLIKNSDWSKAYFQFIIDAMPRYLTHYFFEQQAIIDTFAQHRDKIKIVPQRYMNSYRTDMYPHQSKYDLTGTDGTWQQGDWLIHWPGTSLQNRLALVDIYSPQVIK